MFLFIPVDFALPNKGESILDAYHKWRTRAANKVCCDFALHVGLVTWSDQVNFKCIVNKIINYNLFINNNYKFLTLISLIQIKMNQYLTDNITNSFILFFTYISSF